VTKGPGRRAADGADAGSLARLHARCFPADPWSRAALERLLTLPGAFLRAAPGPGGAPAGFILALIAGGEAEILTLCVAPGARRRGVARTLLTALYARAQAACAARLVLEVAADNPEARALYAAEGFATVGRRPGYYRRKYGAADALILARTV
jgi:[ribosomal protein S18]-alanine N-acetyltransferase